MTHGVTKCKNKGCGVYNIIMEETSYIFENPEMTLIMNRNLSYNVVYIIDIDKCKKKVYIGSARALRTRISLHKSNINLPEKRKLHASNAYTNVVMDCSKQCQYNKLTTTH